MSVSSNSIFQAGNHDVLAFSASLIFVEKIFFAMMLAWIDDINIDAPPYSCIVISICTLFFHSNLHISAL